MPETIRVALITGAARGLGFGIAQRLAQTGIHCILADRNPDVIEVAARLQGPLGACDGRIVDNADEGQLIALIEALDQKYNRLDILVNNAGIHPKTARGGAPRFDEVTLQSWNEVMAINLSSVFILCQRVLPVMRRHNWGRIVNISSRTARAYSPTGGAPYAASKAAVISVTRCVAAENGKFGITANCIAPGFVASPMSQADDGRSIAAYAAIAPVGRAGTPEELAAAVGFLTSEAAGYITGAILDFNGGTFMP